jgi:hypothetical protein
MATRGWPGGRGVQSHQALKTPTDPVRRARNSALYRIDAVMMWWREQDLSISLAANHRQGRRFRAPFANALEAAGAVVYAHSLADPVQIRRFWDMGVGVYSDEPFPPLGTTPPQLVPPTFRENATPA